MVSLPLVGPPYRIYHLKELDTVTIEEIIVMRELLNGHSRRHEVRAHLGRVSNTESRWASTVPTRGSINNIPIGLTFPNKGSLCITRPWRTRRYPT